MSARLLHHGFERAAAAAPDAPALVGAEAGPVSYAALERQSRALAVRLLGSGLPRGARVGVWMRKSPPAVTAQLAILRAGGVYVPFDPLAPAERIARLAADCRLHALIADPGFLAAIAAWSPPAPPVLPVPDPAGVPEASAPLPPSPALGSDLAYILYTSGSTGVPKGVMLSHAHALNFLDWAAASAGVTASDRLASHAPFHFDLSIFDLWAALSHGACVCLLDPVTACFPAAVADWIRDRGITVWYSVPTALVALLPWLAGAPNGHPPLRLRTVLFAGEVFPPAALAALRLALPHAGLQNWFGPTETNVCAAYTLPPAVQPTPDPLPIGAPCARFEFEILDDRRRPVPAGDPGFLWVSGPGLLSGYWGLAEADTASLWCRGDDGVRLYNTGDIVSLGAQGLYYFHGRRDDMVKCRGYRISLLEVQRVLQACPGVRQAAVVAGPDPRQPAWLRAFIVADAAAGADGGAPKLPAEALRYCAERLPAYMVPAEIELRDRLPATSTGKVDRTRLRAESSRAGGAPPT